ncbi:MAG: PilZ domain-containing protein [Phycisphaerae bacterium]|nr:PilZ domain-containing protein [Phycisphaerae bacterium]
MLRTENRSQPRITTRITVESVGPTVNISAGGMCVLMADPMREGLTPTITFELPDEPKPVVAKARIVWCRTSRIDPELYEVGLTFTELSDESRRRVLEFVDAHLSPQKN